MSDTPIAWLAFCFFQAFFLFAFGYLVGTWNTLRQLGKDDDER